MGAHDEAEYPWLASEKIAIQAALNAGQPVLGVCLGAQILATLLGGEVRKGAEPEIGWYPVRFTDAARTGALLAGFPEELMVMHWHSDVFTIPPHCIPMGTSAGCGTQGFYHPERPIAGLQFHMEWDPATAAALTDECGGELTPGPYVQSAATITAAAEARYRVMNDWMRTLLDRLFRPEPTATQSDLY